MEKGIPIRWECGGENKMDDIRVVLFYSILLFFIIYYSVKLAIKPLLKSQEDMIAVNKDPGLVKLRDIEVLSATELEEVTELYWNKDVNEKKMELYKKYEKVLDDLKEMGYLDDTRYSDKLKKLREHFKIN